MQQPLPNHNPNPNYQPPAWIQKLSDDEIQMVIWKLVCEQQRRKQAINVVVPTCPDGCAEHLRVKEKQSIDDIIPNEIKKCVECQTEFCAPGDKCYKCRGFQKENPKYTVENTCVQCGVKFTYLNANRTHCDECYATAPFSKCKTCGRAFKLCYRDRVDVCFGCSKRHGGKK